MNQFNFIGRLTRDPELRYSNADRGEPKAVLKFSLAVPRRTRDDATDFFDMVAFGRTAETMEKYLTKGRQVAVSGSARQNVYEKNGKTFYKVEFIAMNVEFLGSKDDVKSVKPETTDIGDFDIDGEIDMPF